MLLKVVGSIAVLGASTFLGYSLAGDFAKRPQQLRELQSMLQMLENEIAFMSNLLREALHKTGENSKGAAAIFFKEASALLENGSMGASEAWSKAVTGSMGRTSLNQEDQDILITFGKMLGSSDYEGQIKNIRLTITQLQVQESKAEAQRKKNESLYRNLGIMGGLALVIILL